MAEPLVVTALVRKRAELAGEIEATLRRADQLRADLIHIDAALRLFDPESVPESIPPKLPRPSPDWFGRGELSRRIMDTLRQAGEPLCAREIALRIMAAKGLDADDRTLARMFTKRLNEALRRRNRGGWLRREQGPGMLVLWRVAA